MEQNELKKDILASIQVHKERGNRVDNPEKLAEVLAELLVGLFDIEKALGEVEAAESIAKYCAEFGLRPDTLEREPRRS